MASVGTTDGQWPKNALARSVKGPGSSVSQYIDYGPGSKIRQRQEIFLFSTRPRLAVGSTQRLFREVQRLGPGVDDKPHLQPRRGMSGVIPVRCTGTTLPPHTPHYDDSTLMRTFSSGLWGNGLESHTRQVAKGLLFE
jgi:hypothetical protein